MTLSAFNSAVLSIGSTMQHALRQAGDLVYPPVCLSCSVRTGSHGGMCADCWSRLRPVEKPWCDVLGTPFSFDLGEAILSAEAIADPPPFSKARSAVLYDDLAKAMVHRLKYKDRTDLAMTMARWMARAGSELLSETQAIVPVPLHRRRLVTRHYNQSAELSRALARHAGLPHLPASLFRRKATRQQVGLGARARIENVNGAFVVPENKCAGIEGKVILLIDDVYTTGATVKSASKALLKAGAGDVLVLTFARVVPAGL